MKRYMPLIILAAAFIWGAVCYYNDATFVAYLPCLLLVFWAYDL